LVVAVLLVVVGPITTNSTAIAKLGPTAALISPSSDGKPEAATVVVVAPDDGHVDARNVMSCI
jgi:hypothetical protein